MKIEIEIPENGSCLKCPCLGFALVDSRFKFSCGRFNSVLAMLPKDTQNLKFNPHESCENKAK